MPAALSHQNEKREIMKNSNWQSRLHDIWPYSHCLVRLCNEVGGWVGAAKVQAVGAGAMQNQLSY